MIEKEIAELRRTLKAERTYATRVYGCYINGEGAIITEFERSFGLISEEETEQYLSLFRRGLSGTLHKNLMDISFSTAQVEEGTEYRRLQELKKSRLENGSARTEFYQAVASAVKMKENYVLLLLFNGYDVPFYGKDGAADESRGQVFSCIQGLLCPVKSGKAALTYLPKEKTFESAADGGKICPPEAGFLFPAFDNRQTNLYGALFYTRKTEGERLDFSEAVFGKTELPMPAAEQNRNFKTLLAESLGEECSFEVAKKVHCAICDRIEEHKEQKTPEPLLLDKGEIKEILESCGVPEQQVKNFSSNYNESFGAATDLPPKNIVNPSKFEVRTPDVVIRVAKGKEALVNTRVIDGKSYILIAADEGVELNGLSVEPEKEILK